jgi:hypothetical protein
LEIVDSGSADELSFTTSVVVPRIMAGRWTRPETWMIKIASFMLRAVRKDDGGRRAR